MTSTGSYSTYQTFTDYSLNTAVTGTHDLYLVYIGTCNLKSLELNTGLGSKVSAVNFDEESNPNDPNIVQTEFSNTSIGNLTNGSWVKFKKMDFGIGAMSCVIEGSNRNGGQNDTVNLRVDSPTGPMLGSVTIAKTGSPTTFSLSRANTINAGITGVHDVYLVFWPNYGTIHLRSFTLQGREVGKELAATSYSTESAPSDNNIISIQSTSFAPGSKLGNLAQNSWVTYKDFNFGPGTLSSFKIKAASPTGGGQLKLFIDDGLTLRPIGSVNIGATGSLNTFAYFTTTAISSVAAGIYDLRFVFTGGYDIQSFQFDAEAAGTGWTPLVYSPDQAGLEINPLKGLSTLFNRSTSFPISIQAKNFLLQQIMTGSNTYDWTSVDTFINTQAAQGIFSSFQFNIDNGYGPKLPPFLVPLVPILTAPNGALLPDWNDEDLMQALERFIAAMGARYKDESKVFAITQGLYGNWGEWHVGSAGAAYAMTLPNRLRLDNAFATAFPGSNKILARYPTDKPVPKAYGYSDGAFFWDSISPANSFSFFNLLRKNEADLTWQSHPIGGEIAVNDVTTSGSAGRPPVSGFQGVLFDFWPNTVGDDVVDTMNLTHPTYLFASYYFENAVPGSEVASLLRTRVSNLKVN